MIGLQDLLALSDVSPVRVAGDARFSALAFDSRKPVDGALFFCVPSPTRDTHELLPEVKAKGAVAAVVHSDAGFEQARSLGLGCIQLPAEVSEFNAAAGLMCREFYSDPTLDMRVIGITGTNGKTTVAWVLRQALRALGRQAAYLGTLGYQGADALEEMGNTTPFPVELWSRIARAREEGMTDLVLEVSSHALDQRRVEGVRFDLGVFTNLSQDHLDYHQTMEAYADAKKRLFVEVAEASEKPFVAVINLDSPVAQGWREEWERTLAAQDREDPSATYAPFTLSYGFENGTVRAEIGQVTHDRVAMTVTAQAGTAEVIAPLGGRFNAENLLTVFAVLSAIGYAPQEIAGALTEVQPVPGRFEAVENATGVGVIVDYAHTDDALTKVLEAARELEPNRLICVFGCGGDRDKSKRPKMAAVSTRLADHTVFTSDNPRTEDPAAILADVASGATGSFETIPDRADAITSAILGAEPGDLVVIAGKGHENYQIIGREKLPFDDRKVALEALKQRRVRS